MILVTGGCGYIGTHTIVELLNSGEEVLIVDNLVNSSDICLNRIMKITGKAPIFIFGDISDKLLLNNIFTDYDITAVIHFAGLKSVSESNRDALLYFNVNVVGTLNLLQCMESAGVFKLIFSSSATVYGEAVESPISEDAPVGVTKNPYGTSKYLIERILMDLAFSNSKWSVAILRYFNPIGAHSSGLIGEDPSGTPDNLIPFVAQVASGRLPIVEVYGADYDTVDGSGVRDYIHVVDLAIGHIKALGYLANAKGSHVFNLGTGIGYSVFEVLRSFEAITKVTIPYKVVARRVGDVGVSYADVTRSQQFLQWKAKKDLTDMVKDTWNWQKYNPEGYK